MARESFWLRRCQIQGTEELIGPGCFVYSAPEVNKSLNQTGKVRRYIVCLFALLHHLYATLPLKYG